jgi:hypothetical protein
MAIELGPAQAILYGTNAPSNTNVIWGETNNNDPLTWQVINFRRYDSLSATWVIIVSDDPDWQTTNW